MTAGALPIVTILTTAVLALLTSVLAIWVIIQRVRLKVEWGDGGLAEMAQAIRAHANFAEHVPMGLMAIAACELAGGPRILLIGLAAALVGARFLSAIGLLQSLGPSLPRQAGASLTIAATAIAGATAIILATNRF
jgi:uncharacterized protein